MIHLAVRRTTTVLAGLVLAATSLTACGGSGSSAYCQDLKADKASFSSLGSSNPDVSKLDDAFSQMHKLAGEAPDAISDDWKVIDSALTTLQQGLKDAGISFSDLAKMQQGQTPPGVDLQKLQALAGKLQGLTGAKFTTASKNIEKNAKDSCHVTLT